MEVQTTPLEKPLEGLWLCVTCCLPQDHSQVFRLIYRALAWPGRLIMPAPRQPGPGYQWVYHMATEGLPVCKPEVLGL